MMRQLTLCLAALIAFAVPVAAQDPGGEIDCEADPQHQECTVGCPIEMQGFAQSDGSIIVSIQANGTFTLHRQEGDGDFTVLGTFGEDVEYHDGNTTVGVTYTYVATAGPAFCAEIEVTAIPVFPTWFAGVAATSLGVLAYAGTRRRR